MKLLLKLKIIGISLLVAIPCYAGINFNGDADYVDLSTMGNFGSTVDDNGIWVSVWFRTTSTTRAMICGSGNTASSDTSFYFGINADKWFGQDNGYIAMYARNDDGVTANFEVASDTGLYDGNPHHIFYLIKTSINQKEIWFDGVSQTVSSDTSDWSYSCSNFNNSMIFGAWHPDSGPAWFFTGEIIEFAIGQGESSTGVEQIAKSRLKGMIFQTPLASQMWGYYSCDAPLETGINNDTFLDMSGKGYNGTGVDADGDSSIIGETSLSYPPQPGFM